MSWAATCRASCGSCSTVGLVGIEQPHELLQLRLERVERLQRERGSRGGSQLSTLAMLIHLLTSTVEGVLLGVEQMLHEEDQLDLAALVDAIPRAVLRRIQ